MSGYGPVAGTSENSRERRLPLRITGVSVTRRLVSITLDNLDDLPQRCRRCVFWELDPVTSPCGRGGDPALEKEAWISSTLLD